MVFIVLLHRAVSRSILIVLDSDVVVGYVPNRIRSPAYTSLKGCVGVATPNPLDFMYNTI